MRINARKPRIMARMFLAVPLLAGMAVLSACASGTTDDGVPSAGAVSEAAQGTGTFPNLNLPRKGATAQFTAAEQKEKTSELTSLREANETTVAPGSLPTSADQATLSKLGKTEPQKVLKQIESGQ